jgi:hypothetical protein
MKTQQKRLKKLRSKEKELVSAKGTPQRCKLRKLLPLRINTPLRNHSNVSYVKEMCTHYDDENPNPNYNTSLGEKSRGYMWEGGTIPQQ